MATDAEKIAEASTKRWRQHFERGRYFRFNVDHGLQTVGMKEYRKKREIQATTDKYLDSQVQSFWVQRCVENLVLKKRSTRPDFELLIAHELKSTDARVLFHRYVSTENVGRWFLIIDDADADGDFLSPVAQPETVLKNLPQSKEGRVLFITHSMKAASAAVQEQASQIVKVEGMEGPDAISILRHSLFSEHKKSIALLEETLPIQQQTLGKTHFDTLKIQVYLIEQYSKIKDLAKAISLLEELVPIQRKTLGQVHQKTMSSENDLAELYLENRNVYTALKLYEHIVSVRQKKLEPGDEQRKWAEVRYQKCIETWKWTWARR
ncbi:calcium-independent phospholipase A2-gamma [Fusarium mundagurra]|uniref:Calcium-independent phospholipase A2-gamma n=1 Tax=Fusarium mundagurra TaxID=1567541 RepID=A0A8H6DKJ7_9HYPO|nr:calcium-independent phospholipase A2-gamma [Fusarium mundagurra]